MRVDVEKISNELQVMMRNKVMASRCVLCTAYGYKRLSELGYNVKICFGFAAFSVNKERHGIISFGAESDRKYMDADAPNVVDGHYWLKLGNTIIDFSMLFIEETRDMLDDISRLKTGAILLSKDPIVREHKNKPLLKLQQGAIAHHYNLKQIVSYDNFSKKYGSA